MLFNTREITKQTHRYFLEYIFKESFLCIVLPINSTHNQSYFRKNVNQWIKTKDVVNWDIVLCHPLTCKCHFPPSFDLQLSTIVCFSIVVIIFLLLPFQPKHIFCYSFRYSVLRFRFSSWRQLLSYSFFFSSFLIQSLVLFLF